MSKPLTKIQASARNQECTLNIAGVCNYDPETTVLCHIGFKDGSGKRIRPGERNAVYGCSACHDAIDHRTGQFTDPYLSVEENWYIARALVRTAEARDRMGI